MTKTKTRAKTKTRTKTKAVRKFNLPVWAWGALALLVAVVGGFLIFGGGSSEPLADAVSVQQAAELRDQGAFVLDVREPGDWTAGHIPGATLIPLSELQARLSEVPQDQTVLVYCRSGLSSAMGRDLLKAAGYARVTSLSGGFTAWTAAGYDTAVGE